MMYLNKLVKTLPLLGLLCFKLSQPLRKTNHGQKCLSYVAPSIWNKSPDFLKTTDNFNTYKHRVKKHFFQRMNNEEDNIYSYF